MPFNNSVNVALAQFNILEGEKKKNLSKALEHVARAAADGADIVLMPEMFLTGYPPEIPMAQLAETMHGESIRKIRESAANNGIAVVGSFPEWDGDLNTGFNTAFFIDRGGELLGKYRKIHLFDREKDFVSAGEELTVIEDRGIRYGMLICFDLEFPEPSRALAMDGIQVLLVVSANMEPYGPFHRVFARARAIENHLFVAYSNRTGGNSSYKFCGESCLIDPLGEVVCELSREEGVVSAEVRLDCITRSKTVYDYLAQRKVLFNA